MRIGIDARFLTHPQNGGFKSYTVNLLAALPMADPEYEYIAYVDREPDHRLPNAKNLHYKVVASRVPLVGMPWREQFGLRQQIRRDHLDLVHLTCNTGPLDLGLRTVVTLHDTIPLLPTPGIHPSLRPGTFRRWTINMYARSIIPKVARRAERVLTVSHYAKAEIMGVLGIPGDKVCVTHIAVNDAFRPGDPVEREAWRREIRAQFSVDKPFILTVGFEPRKNVPLVMDSFTHIASDHELSLVIVAAEETSRRCFQELALERGIGDRVHVLGAIPLDRLAALYNLAEVFVFASAREGFGLPPLEAMACGAPVIAMGRSSLPEILSPAAVLVDSDDSRVWAKSIDDLVRDPDTRAILAREGPRHAGTFSWTRCAEETVSVYRSVFADTKTPSQTGRRI